MNAITKGLMLAIVALAIALMLAECAPCPRMLRATRSL